MAAAHQRVWPEMDAYRDTWWKTFAKRGHEPVLNSDGEPDQFARSSYGHNGPQCKACGWGACWWCVTPPHIPRCSASNNVRDDDANNGDDQGHARGYTRRKKAALCFKNGKTVAK